MHALRQTARRRSIMLWDSVYVCFSDMLVAAYAMLVEVQC